MNTLFAGLGRSVFGKTRASGRTQDLGHSFSQYGSPGRQITYMYYSGLEKNLNFSLLLDLLL